ncbi:MAG: hypothetical protein VCA73_18245 [Roseibacillus sp.]
MESKKSEATGFFRGCRIALGVLLIVVGTAVGFVGGWGHYLTGIGFAESDPEDVTFLVVTLIGIGMVVGGMILLVKKPKKTSERIKGVGKWDWADWARGTPGRPKKPPEDE